MSADGQDRPTAGVLWKPDKGEALASGAAVAITFLPNCFNRALVLGDGEILCKITGVSPALKAVVLLFKAGYYESSSASCPVPCFTGTVRLSTRYSQ